MRDEEAALDIVQDAMLRLAEKYGHRPVAELPMLFHRIVQNAVRDWFRRQKVRSLWTTLLSSLTPGSEDDDRDPLETLEPADGSNRESTPRWFFFTRDSRLARKTSWPASRFAKRGSW